MKNGKRTVSMRFILSILLMITLAAVIFVTAYTSRVAEDSLQKQAAENTLTTLSYYIDSMDASLSEADRHLYDFILNSSDVAMLNLDATEGERYSAMLGVSTGLGRVASFNQVLDGAMFYSPLGSEREYITKATSVLSLSESNTLRDHIIGIVERLADREKLDSSKWFLDAIDGKDYIIRLISSNDAYCGAWVSIDSLRESVNGINFGENSVSLICSSDGRVIGGSAGSGTDELTFGDGWQSYTSPDGSKYVQVCGASSVGEFKVAAMIPTETITKDLDRSMSKIKRLSVLAYLTPVIMFVCIILIYRPLSTLVGSMKRVGGGDMEVQIEPKSRLSEFHVVEDIFNSMVSEIKHLKISIYEQKLDEQKIKSQYLQMQLKSHFFLNCLNIIYSLSAVKDYKLIQKLTLSLVKYFRYISRDASKVVTIQSELEHIVNYMEIQKLRFPDVVTYETDVDPELYGFEIPTLMIQTFMENSIEHAIDFERLNVIKLTVKRRQRDGEDGVSIRIEDNGIGFDAETLEKMNDDDVPIITDAEKGIGINNIRNRLGLMYGDRAVIRICDAEPTGTVVDIWLPQEPHRNDRRESADD